MNDLSKLKTHLFECLDKLSAKDCDIEAELKRANAIVAVSSTIVETYKTEYVAMKMMLQYGYLPTDDIAEGLGLKSTTKQIL